MACLRVYSRCTSPAELSTQRGANVRLKHIVSNDDMRLRLGIRAPFCISCTGPSARHNGQRSPGPVFFQHFPHMTWVLSTEQACIMGTGIGSSKQIGHFCRPSVGSLCPSIRLNSQPRRAFSSGLLALLWHPVPRPARPRECLTKVRLDLRTAPCAYRF